MLTFFDRRPVGSFPRIRRRDFLKVGTTSAALAAMGLHSDTAMAAKDNTLASLPDWASGKSVVLLFLHGGPTQIETFDPKMSAPAGVRSVTGEVATRLSGISFGGTFPRLAALAHRCAVVRSFQAGDGNHDIKPVVGTATAGANLGALYTRLVGANHPVTGMPLNTALFPRSVDPDAEQEQTGFGNFRSTGSLGNLYAPFVPGGDGEAQAAMQLEMPQDQLDDRRSLLMRLDRLKRQLDRSEQVAGAGRLQQQAFDTILGGVADAFDLANEDPRLVERYDTAPLVHPDSISKSWNNHRFYRDNAQSLGKLMLMARRLCEHGCGFVTVTTNFVWDMHSDVNNAGVEEGMQYMGWPLDHAISAFIEDVDARGLSDDILLIVTGEMGRTPRINAKGGRDHWGGLTPLLLYGGGLNMGQVIGHSNADASQPAGEPLRIPNLIATAMHSLVDVGELRTITGIPADVMRAITAADPIPGLH